MIYSTLLVKIREISVPFEFVDSFNPQDQEILPSKGEEFRRGQYVVITRGKNEGRAGKVAVVK